MVICLNRLTFLEVSVKVNVRGISIGALTCKNTKSLVRPVNGWKITVNVFCYLSTVARSPLASASGLPRQGKVRFVHAS